MEVCPAACADKVVNQRRFASGSLMLLIGNKALLALDWASTLAFVTANGPSTA